jgi:hypothetical protein
MENERPTKKIKLFQNTLPPEMIENIVLLCPNIITLEALACTCKQIHSLVSKVPKKSIRVSFDSSVLTAGSLPTKTKANYTIESNGNALNQSEDDIRTHGSRDQKIRTVLKKLEYRYMFDKLYEEIIEILNMTDTAKLTQILELYKEDPVFSLKVDRMQFNIDLDSQFELDYVFLYIQQDKINKMEIMYPQWVIHGGDPDEDLNWDLRDKKIATRLRCALCVVKVREFFKRIPFMERKEEKSLAIEYRKDAVEYEGWDFSFDDSGHVKVCAFEIDDMPWRFMNEKKIESIQVRPSIVEEMFVVLEKYFNSKNLNAFKEEKDSSEDENETGDQNSEAALEAENESDKNSEEDENTDDDDEDEKYEASFGGRRTVETTLNGAKVRYNFDAGYFEFEELLEVVRPIMNFLDTPMSHTW